MSKNTPRWDDPERIDRIMDEWKKTDNYKYFLDLLKRLAKE